MTDQRCTHYVSVLYLGHRTAISAKFGEYQGPRYDPKCSCGWAGERGNKVEAQGRAMDHWNTEGRQAWTASSSEDGSDLAR